MPLLDESVMEEEIDRSTSAPPASSLWDEAVEHTRLRSPASFEQWFSSVQLDAFDGSSLRLGDVARVNLDAENFVRNVMYNGRSATATYSVLSARWADVDGGYRVVSTHELRHAELGVDTLYRAVE